MIRFLAPGLLLLLGLASAAVANADSAPEAVFTGTVTSVTKSDLAIQADGGNVLSFSILHRTKFLKEGRTVKWSDVHNGDTVTVQAGEDPTGHPSAITVTIGKPPADKNPQPST